ncbi:MAG: hypothetical protein IT378_06145 [Sandaracinaceae bacterium]|nr:hypothetical protein [Sandaracinaceae bacterium]
MRPLLLMLALLLSVPAAADPPAGSAAPSAAQRSAAQRSAAQRSATQRSAAQHDALVARTVAEGASRRVLALLGQSRAERNPTHARCIDGKLSQIHGFSRMIEERHRRLSDAERRGDAGLVAHERQAIRRLAVQLRTLERDAVRCLYPELEGDDGRTVVVVTVSRDVPDEDVGAYLARSR